MTTQRQPLSGPILLISCYELGHQPLAIASAGGWLATGGFAPDLLDLAIDPLDEALAAKAGLVAISTPMHTALRLAVPLAQRIRRLNPTCHITFFGHYAILNRDYLLENAADSVMGGESEGELLSLVRFLKGVTPQFPAGVSRVGQPQPPVLRRLPPFPPRREGLPPLGKYARMEWQGQETTVGYVETTHGCKHLCRHCPIPPVYGGRFFAVEKEAVLEDISRLVEAGAGHITFGDPDFLNGPSHAERIVVEMHHRFPALTFDFTAKVSHIVAHAPLVHKFGTQGCLFAVSAVESLSERVLLALRKGHAAEDVDAALTILRAAGIAMRPSLVPFTPWSTLEDYLELLRFVRKRGLLHHLEPVQFAIRLLVPPGSLLEDSPDFLPFKGVLHRESFSYRWEHPDPRMDQLQLQVAAIVEKGSTTEEPTEETFAAISRAAFSAAGLAASLPEFLHGGALHAPAPRLSEPWFC